MQHDTFRSKGGNATRVNWHSSPKRGSDLIQQNPRPSRQKLQRTTVMLRGRVCGGTYGRVHHLAVHILHSAIVSVPVIAPPPVMVECCTCPAGSHTKGYGWMFLAFVARARSKGGL